jgi:hypothetical protein
MAGTYRGDRRRVSAPHKAPTIVTALSTNPTKLIPPTMPIATRTAAGSSIPTSLHHPLTIVSTTESASHLKNPSVIAAPALMRNTP